MTPVVSDTERVSHGEYLPEVATLKDYRFEDEITTLATAFKSMVSKVA